MRRYELRAFSPGSRHAIDLENPFTSFKTTEIHITSELAPVPAKTSADVHSKLDVTEIEAIGRGYDRYTVTIASTPRTALPPTPPGDTVLLRQRSTTLEANTAAWGYTKIALLFFVSLLVTWVNTKLSSINAGFSGIASALRTEC